ncbi:MAG: hypothetical protein E7271_07280 [Lachnospiraceae bacterium]|jgi:hypothetical protein|nr:hypothetical protein [Lachnospiraceae bacterium]
MDKKKIFAIILSVLISVFITGANAHALSPEVKQQLMDEYRAGLESLHGTQLSDEQIEAMTKEYIDKVESAITGSTYTTSENRYADEDKYVTYVNSADEFFEEVCYQLKAHRKIEYYDTDVEILYNNSDYVFHGIDNYYFKDDPMMSSGYLIGFCTQGTTTYSCEERDIPGEKKYRIGIKFQYAYTQEEIEKHSDKMKELSQSLKRENDLESVKAVHDYLIEKFDWKDEIKDSIAGFKYSGATGIGYSMSVYELLQNMGINVMIVGGNVTVDGQEGYNTWNVVELDGKWYNLDVSWDDNDEYGAVYDWFLKNNADFERHSYKDEDSNIKDMISEESCSVPRELFYNSEVSDNNTTEQYNYKIIKKKHMTPGQLAQKLWYLAIYLIVGIAYIIRRKKIIEKE